MSQWKMRQSELRVLQGRLNEGKASLTLTIVALTGGFEGKQQGQVKDDLVKIYQEMTDSRGSKRSKAILKRLEENVDAESVAEGQTSLSATTDRGLIVARYLKENPNIRDIGLEGSGASSPEEKPLSDDIGSPDDIFEAIRNQNTPLLKALISRNITLSSRSA